jgi:hypothetical protein
MHGQTLYLKKIITHYLGFVEIDLEKYFPSLKSNMFKFVAMCYENQVSALCKQNFLSNLNFKFNV